MSRIAEKLSSLKEGGRKALIPYITPEFPVRGVTVPLLLELERAGADLAEIGIPFSDPLADGATIQHSSEVALRNGVTLEKVLEYVRETRKKSEIPILLMGYLNPMLRFGIGRLMEESKGAGVDGFIIPDLPPEESSDFVTAAKDHGLSTVFLIAPTSSDERIKAIDAFTTDFSYCVSLVGVTGARERLGRDDELRTYLRRVRENTKKPFVVGFGISKREHLDLVYEFADGAVVGSALISSLERCESVQEAIEAGSEFFRQLQNLPQETDGTS